MNEEEEEDGGGDGEGDDGDDDNDDADDASHDDNDDDFIDCEFTHVPKLQPATLTFIIFNIIYYILIYFIQLAKLYVYILTLFCWWMWLGTCISLSSPMIYFWIIQIIHDF